MLMFFPSLPDQLLYLCLDYGFSFQMSNPWEIVRNDVAYPIKFYGKVLTDSDGKKHWIGGEDIQAVAYDVPIPGYETKTTINLRLWSTKAPSGDFDLSVFNSGKHTQAAEALYNAEKVSLFFRYVFLLLAIYLLALRKLSYLLAHLFTVSSDYLTSWS